MLPLLRVTRFVAIGWERNFAGGVSNQTLGGSSGRSCHRCSDAGKPAGLGVAQGG